MGEFIFELDEDMAKDLLIKVLATSKTYLSIFLLSNLKIIKLY